jgi:hypothetical protein
LTASAAENARNALRAAHAPASPSRIPVRNPVDALYFSVSTLTTTSVSDPDLVGDDGWVKIFTILHQLIGIGILVEILRLPGLSFVEVRRQESQRDPHSAPEHP